MAQGSRQLQPLPRGAEVAIQDPAAGGKPGRWTKTGTIIECLPFDSYMVRVHGSRAVTKRNRVHLKEIMPLVPEQYIIPVSHPVASHIPEETKTETSERFVAVQPPRRWPRLSPETHRRAPAARPGEDVITKLKDEEERAAVTGVGGVQQSIVMDVWEEIKDWRSRM